MKLLIIAVSFILLGLSVAKPPPNSIRESTCPDSQMPNHNCGLDPKPGCARKPTESGKRPCTCKDQYVCDQDGRTCHYFCKPPILGQALTGNSEMGLMAGLVDEMKENGPETFELEHAAGLDNTSD